MIPNPMPNGNCRVQADLDATTFRYFFAQVLAGDRGNRQALIATFFSKLHEACLTANIEPSWDPTNESRVIAILDRLNFNPVQAQTEPKRKRAPRTGLADHPVAVVKAQPVDQGHDGGTTRRKGKRTPNGGNISPDPGQSPQS